MSVGCVGVRGKGKGKRDVPDVIEDGCHGSLFGLADCFLESLSFAFAICDCWVRTDCTIGIHGGDCGWETGWAGAPAVAAEGSFC